MSNQNIVNQIDHADGDEPVCNFSKNPTFDSIIEKRISRRSALKGLFGAAVLGFVSPTLAMSRSNESAGTQAELGFKPVEVSMSDDIRLPEGYQYQVILPFETPIPHPQRQNLFVGSHHDGMHFFPIDSSSDNGLLVINHEYIEPRFLHESYAGQAFSSSAVERLENGKRSTQQVQAEMSAHGVSIVHIRKDEQGQWKVVNDVLNRRIDASSLMVLSGPVKGHQKVKTAFSPDGTQARGTLNNCANGVTPWGTYLTCEENWAGYFINETEQPREQSRYGVRSQNHSRYAWELAESSASQYQRFNAAPYANDAMHDFRNEPNTFGWVVEVDPFNPETIPVKRTALGRFAHEGVVFREAVLGQPLVCYMGDDARFEYIYKYVSRQNYQPGLKGDDLLDDGVLYVARFYEDGKGEWLPLVFGQGLLTPAHGFESQADVLLNTRLAADKVGATKMDRPEWGAVHPDTGEVYFTLTNNTKRMEDQVDNSNPRPQNHYGHIIRWKESSQSSTRFDWDIFVLAGDEADSRLGESKLDENNRFSSPDGLYFDAQGRLWVQTDMSEKALQSDGWKVFGNNQMLACDVEKQEIRRFMVGPIGQEITGISQTPDGKTLFVNIQHPGATTSAEEFAQGDFRSHWPMGKGLPRSACVVISRKDSGVIGA